MLFLKRCFDVFEERREQVIAENRLWHKTTFYVLEHSRWDYLVKEAHKHVGDFLNEALGGLEQGNTSLQDVLEHIDFNRKLGQSVTWSRRRGKRSATCAQCHALPDPQQHSDYEWPGVVARMQRERRCRMCQPLIRSLAFFSVIPGANNDWSSSS